VERVQGDAHHHPDDQSRLTRAMQWRQDAEECIKLGALGPLEEIQHLLVRERAGIDRQESNVLEAKLTAQVRAHGRRAFIHSCIHSVIHSCWHPAVANTARALDSIRDCIRVADLPLYLAAPRRPGPSRPRWC